MVTLPAALAEAIEDYRFANRLKTEAEAIRQLLELGLKSAGENKPPSQTRGRRAAPAQRKGPTA
jgi:hypothetical protein